MSLMGLRAQREPGLGSHRFWFTCDVFTPGCMNRSPEAESLVEVEEKALEVGFRLFAFRDSHGVPCCYSVCHEHKDNVSFDGATFEREFLLMPSG